jgi:2-phosphosulfolactate phosphatase
VSNGECDGIDGPAVVVDVLRAFSFAACAFSAGAERVLLVAELEEALRLKRQHPGAVACKDGPPAEGFEFLNSPAAVMRTDLSGRVVVQRTSAGTQGAVAARHATPLLCASLLTARATAELFRGTIAPQPVTFVITGDEGCAEEDLACAEYIAAMLTADDVDDVAPNSYVRRAASSKTAAALREALRRGFVGVDPGDLDVCLSADHFGFAMAAQDDGHVLALRPHA